MTELIDRLIKRVRDLEAELLAVRRDYACQQTWTARKEADLDRAAPLVKRIAEATGTPYDQLIGPWRDSFTCKCRTFCYWYLRQEGFSLSATAAALGRAANETVVSGVRTVEDRLETDKKYVQWHEKMLAALNKT